MFRLPSSVAYESTVVLFAQGPLPTERPEVQQMLPKDLLELTTLTLQKDPARRIEVRRHAA
eukprot:5577467-Pleurochrysis_carterae.AAC.1